MTLGERKSERTVLGMPLWHIGRNARGFVAVGSVFEKIGELTSQDVIAVKESLETIVPTCFSWAKDVIKLFL